MSSYMKDIAKILGVELEEVFSIKHEGVVYDSCFKLTEFGLAELSDNTGCWVMIGIDSLLNGYDEIIKRWRPNIGGYYYVPMLTPCASHRYEMHRWDGGNFDKFWLNHGLVCKTEEEAIKLAQKMLATVVKE